MCKKQFLVLFCVCAASSPHRPYPQLQCWAQPCCSYWARKFLEQQQTVTIGHCLSITAFGVSLSRSNQNATGLITAWELLASACKAAPLHGAKVNTLGFPKQEIWSRQPGPGVLSKVSPQDTHMSPVSRMVSSMDITLLLHCRRQLWWKWRLWIWVTQNRVGSYKWA